MTAGELYDIIDAAIAHAAQTPRWRRSHRLVLQSNEPTITVGGSTWHAVRQRDDGQYLFTLRQARQMQRALVSGMRQAYEPRLWRMVNDRQF